MMQVSRFRWSLVVFFNHHRKHILCMMLIVQVPYRLHAVLVHEGQANAGHYWAYIYDRHHQRWMKYNDIAVTKSSWEELVRDSFGGYRNASAYCLMYIDDKKPFLIQGNPWYLWSIHSFCQVVQSTNCYLPYKYVYLHVKCSPITINACKWSNFFNVQI